MRTLTIITLVILTLQCFGQNQYIGLRSGIGLNNVDSKAFLDDTGNRLGFTFGLTYEAELKNHFFVGTDLLYSQKGFTDEIMLTDDNGVFMGKKTTKFNYDYLSIPFKGGIKRGNKVSGSVSLGIVPSILLQNKTFYPLSNGENMKIDGEKANRFDLAGLVELSCYYEFNSSVRFFTSVLFQRSVTTMTNSDYFSDSKIWNKGGILSLGISYKLIN